MRYPQASEQDPDFADDPAILDEEELYRGIKQNHLPQGSAGPISSAAFKTKQWSGVRRHVSVFRKSLCAEREVFGRLPKSVALASLSAQEARGHKPEIQGVAPAHTAHPAHSRIIRNRTVPDDRWNVIAFLLAEASQITHLRPVAER